MRFLSYSTGGETRFGLAAEAGVIDLKSRLGVGSLKALIAAGGLSRAAAFAGQAADHPWDAVAFLPVIPDPDKIICIGINYEEHRAETGRSAAAHPTVFTRFADTQVGQGQPIIKPKVSETVDYEGELAVVIGREARGVSEADALGHVAGFACYNDVSIRDFQRHTTQFTPGKNFPGTGPFGPYLVTPDEVGPLGPQRIQTRLNGQVVQDSTLGHMIFDVPKLIAYLSLWTLLRPGDVIVTGTPGGVGAARTPPLWMKPGDEVEVEIDRVGLLKNRVAAET
ncbi:MAG TPA: fumarylacetoacetate hydrolase family protein [Caulobacteraceae bacterium]|jgi:2-keto-4-pentenoate hydratase/2-oxohepta-3-ene-1,7-dioic acid hydratase in catechol pathway|nr:fumarylacetoacetate hydrolase family protein [Caulobacteraceae bacterium]